MMIYPVEGINKHYNFITRQQQQSLVAEFSLFIAFARTVTIIIRTDLVNYKTFKKKKYVWIHEPMHKPKKYACHHYSMVFRLTEIRCFLFTIVKKVSLHALTSLRLPPKN